MKKEGFIDDVPGNTFDTTNLQYDKNITYRYICPYISTYIRIYVCVIYVHLNMIYTFAKLHFCGRLAWQRLLPT